MSMMAMGVEAGVLRPGDHVLGTAAGENFTALVVSADEVKVDGLTLVHFNLLDDAGVVWDFLESDDSVMTVVVWGDDDV